MRSPGRVIHRGPREGVEQGAAAVRGPHRALRRAVRGVGALAMTKGYRVEQEFNLDTGRNHPVSRTTRSRSPGLERLQEAHRRARSRASRSRRIGAFEPRLNYYYQGEDGGAAHLHARGAQHAVPVTSTSRFCRSPTTRTRTSSFGSSMSPSRCGCGSPRRSSRSVPSSRCGPPADADRAHRRRRLRSGPRSGVMKVKWPILSVGRVGTLALVVPSCGRASAKIPTRFPTSPGTAGPGPFKLVDLEGPWTLEELQGKPVFINFWSTWCGPCKMEHPMLAAGRQALPRRPVPRHHLQRQGQSRRNPDEAGRPTTRSWATSASKA